jgi:hypothetical protein
MVEVILFMSSWGVSFFLGEDDCLALVSACCYGMSGLSYVLICCCYGISAC